MNGPSNIMLLMVSYIIFGIYAVSFNRVDMQMYETSMHSVKLVVSEQNALSALAIASGKLGSNKTVLDFTQKITLNEGTIDVTATRTPTSTMKVTAVSHYYNETFTVIRTYIYHNGRWKPIGTYTKPQA